MSARDRILDGAAEVMRTHGLANTTTKEIGRAAGLSEAMLYKVFRDKTDLFMGVLTERLPQVAMLRSGAAEYVGAATVGENLRKLVAQLLAFYLESFPIAASLFSDPDLLRAHNEALRARDAGPHRVAEGVATYLSAEQRGGRVTATVHTPMMAELLVGACLHRAFLIRFRGESISQAEIERFAESLADTLAPMIIDQ